MIKHSIFRKSNPSEMLSLWLYSERTFYEAFVKDLKHAKQEVIIESPQLTQRRLQVLLPAFKKLWNKKVRVVVNTKQPDEHDRNLKIESLLCVHEMQNLGIDVFHTLGLHRKIAIIDQEILWDGSLKILSQNNSCEVMRRIESEYLAIKMTSFIKVERNFAL